MADSNMTQLAGALKRVYDDKLVRQQNLKHRLIDELGKSRDKRDASGEGFFGAIRDYNNETVGAINEEEQFRTIDGGHATQFKVLPKINVAPIQFSGLLAKAAEGNDESFANMVMDELDIAKELLRKDENRQFFGYGLGVLSAPAAAIASNLTSLTVTSAQYFRANQVIDIFTSTGGAAVSTSTAGLRISDVDKINNIIYLNSSVQFSLATTAVIVKQNILSSSPPADGKEMMGLRGIVDDGTDLTIFQNINATTVGNLIWRSRRINASSANLTSDLLQRLITDVKTLSGDEPDTLVTHPLQMRKYLDLVVPQKRYNDQDLDAGYRKLSFNGLRFHLDEDCQSDTLYALTLDRIKLFEVAPMAMGTHDGSDIFLRVANYDVFQAYWKHYANFGTDRRNCHGKIVSLAVPTGVA